MNLALSRSAHTPCITEGEDHCAAVFDAQGNLIMQGDTDLPIFIGIIEFPCKAVVEKYGPGGINPGDVIMTNSAFAGGSHINDIIVMRPLFYEGELIGFTSAIGHWTDVGGSQPGSIVPGALEYFEEGVLYPPIKIIEAGRLNQPVLDIIMANCRTPEATQGDLEAQIASLATGEDRILSLIDKYGWARIKSFMTVVQERSEAMLRAKIAELPDGVYAFEDRSDYDTPTNPEPILIKLSMIVAGETITFDFTGSSPQSRSSSNATLGITTSGVLVVTKCMFPDIPMNHGIFKALRIIAPTGTVVNAQPPAAISGAFATVLEKVVGTALGAFAQILPADVIACPYNMVNISLGGYDLRTNNSYVMYIYSEGGLGARAALDGVSGVVSLFGGSTKFPPVEVLEKRYPILFTEWGFEQDSGGPGAYRGGVGSKKFLKITADQAQLMVLGDRGKYPPFGLAGGMPGATQRLEVVRADGTKHNLDVKLSGFKLYQGDEVRFYSSGGGGYGDPLEREPARVLADVQLGMVSEERGRTDYGVVLKGRPLVVDACQTEYERRTRRDHRVSGIGRSDV